MKKLICFILTLTLAVPLLALFPLPAVAAGDTGRNTMKDLWMVMDVARGAIREKPVDCPAPFEKDGTVYAPLSLIATYLKAEMQTGTDRSVTVTGYPKIPAAEITYVGDDAYLPLDKAASTFSLNSYYDPTMRMAALSTGSLDYNIYLREDVLTLYALSTKICYQYPNRTDGIYQDIQNHIGVTTHPRLAATQDDFDALRAVYESDAADLSAAQQRLKAWIVDYVRTAYGSFKKFFKINPEDSYEVIWLSEKAQNLTRQPYLCYDENGEALYPDVVAGLYTRGTTPSRLLGRQDCSYTYDENTMLATYVHYDKDGNVDYSHSALFGDGYDYGERLGDSELFTIYLMQFGFAWQMTGDQIFVDAFEMLAMQMASWLSWGDGHFLDAADAAEWYSLGLDWIWHAFDDTPEKQEAMTAPLFDKVVRSAYYTHGNFSGGCSGDAIPRAGQYVRISSTRQGGAFFYYRDSNWNNVCTAGLTMAGLMTVQYGKYRDMTCETLAEYFETLYNSLSEYSPDGSYAEGPAYWAYATSTFFMMCACLNTSCGTDYGFMTTPGMSETCYYAYLIGNSKNQIWTYHDCTATIDIACISYAADYYDNSDYTVFRKSSMETGANYSAFDILFFREDFENAETSPSRIRYMLGADTVTMRSDFSQNATFTGLHVGPNSGHHSDIDSGSYILDMGGIRWLNDPGAEEYNIDKTGNYFDIEYRFYYYRKTAEAHNLIFINSDLPELKKYGQTFNTYEDDFATVSKTMENEHGSLAVADTTAQYGSSCLSAKRAVMITADGKSVVVQDELAFDRVTSITWLANFSDDDSFNVTLSEDERTAFVRSGDKTLRATLISDYRKLKFEFRDKNADPLRDTTIALTSKANLDENGNVRYPLASWTVKKLVISADTLRNYRFAVVYDMYEDGHEVDYTMTDIDNMVPAAAKTPGGTDPDPDQPGKTYDYTAKDLQAALDEMPEFSKKNALAYAEALLGLYKVYANTDPASEEYATVKTAYRTFLRESADTIDEINDLIFRIEQVRTGQLYVTVKGENK